MLISGNIFIALVYLVLSIGYIRMLHVQNSPLNFTMHALLIICIAIHLLFLFLIGITRGVIALTTIFETLSTLAVFMALTLLLLETKLGENTLGAFILPLIFFIQVLSTLSSHVPLLNKSIVEMPLFTIHMITTIVGYTFFIYSFILGIMHLYILRKFRKKKFNNLFFKLPSLKIIEKLNLTALSAGFIMLSLGLLTGSRLAYLIWKSIPFSDPKIFLSLALWVIYLFNLIIIGIFKFKGRVMSYCSIAGFILIIIIFMSENFVRTTLHNF